MISCHTPYTFMGTNTKITRDDKIASTMLYLNPNSETKQQIQHCQDGKRTLIKNQLYLIEQLQLENANLRNERDQLHLENEELKFQLQMISSSSILGQSNNAFDDDRQLEKLVESDSGSAIMTTATTSNGATAGPALDTLLPSRQQTNSSRPDCRLSSSSRASNMATSTIMPGNNHYYFNGKQIITPTSDMSRLTVTPSRQPMRPVNDNRQQQQQQRTSQRQCQSGTAKSRPFTLKSSASTLDCRGLKSNTSELNNRSIFSKRPASALTTPAINSKYLSAKSTSLSAFNVIANLVPLSALSHNNTDGLLTINQDEQDNDGDERDDDRHDDDHHHDEDDDNNELLRCKLVQQRYGADSERVYAAAIVIQRAFRKYQIYKRFRMITEQLRQACQSSPTNSQPLDRQQCQLAGERETSRSQRLASSVAKPNAGPNQAIAFVSGATRAAAWESLSQAASRLAASAVNATASTKQAFSNGVAKSASCQQVASRTAAAAGPQQARQTSKSSTIASNATTNSVCSSLFRPSSVVAAAINFQQLESIRKRQYRVGLNVFNKNPEKGVSYLIAHSFIDCTPPYTKASNSYYLSNQLHFIDKQQLTAPQQSIISGLNSDSDKSDQPSQNCRLCYEEENLKRNVAHFLLHRKGLAKEKIGQYLGNLQSKFNQDVLKYYLQELDFGGLQVDVALRKFSSTMRMPGEAQKIERFVDCFAQRYVQCQQLSPNVYCSNVNSNQIIQLAAATDGMLKSNDPNWVRTNQSNEDQRQSNKSTLALLSKDEIFILTFAIIMLNTDLHSPSLKSSSRMSANQFVNNLRGVFKSATIDESYLIEIYERVKANQITTTPDHVTHVMKVQQGLTTNNFQKKELPNLCVPHRRLVCFCRLFEVYDINKKERIGQHQREIFLFNDMLLVTKLSRRARTSTPQQYTYRQSIPLQGLYIHLFQTTHYQFGIRLSRRTNEETLIMFNARNELDQSRFVEDLNESIAEMDEMEAIKASNLVDTIHFKQQDRLSRHAMSHNSESSPRREDSSGILISDSSKENTNAKSPEANNVVGVKHSDDDMDTTKSTNITVVAADNLRRLPSKFSSLSNLASVAEIKNEENNISDANRTIGLRPNRSFVHQAPLHEGSRNQLRQPTDTPRESSQFGIGHHRYSSTNSVHSLDSGLFLSRDVSPNQSG